MTTKRVYLFSEGNRTMKSLLGGKGANLAEMTNIGLNVPSGFTITTETCNEYSHDNHILPEGLVRDVERAISHVEETTGKRFGDPEDPLLFSVRSGAEISMPGMMDTVLNLGLNPDSLEGLAKASGSRRFALDCYRRLIQMFADIVLDIDIELFESQLAAMKREKGARSDIGLDEGSLESLVDIYLGIIEEYSGHSFPTEPMEQLKMAVEAVFRSWNNPRASTYRKLNGIDDDLGTAVNIQTMVYGNIGQGSGTGVGFTRDPATGQKIIYGEYLMQAQGEDVVAGIRTPRPIRDMANELPERYNELVDICSILEGHYKDMQDFEFTIERGKLYILQTRNGKRTAQAAMKIAHDMVSEELIDRKQAILMIDPNQITQLLHRQIDPKARYTPLGRGIPASPGTAVGKAVFSADDAVEWEKRKEQVILVRTETKPDDIHGFHAAAGILTARGGKTSHAAVVARGMGKPCVSGCEDLAIDHTERSLRIKNTRIREGEWITIDGLKGEVMVGQVPTIDPNLSSEALEILRWADEIRTLGVWANASTPEEARKAKEFGAEGIGLCRTERMFNDTDRLPVVLEMILAEDQTARQAALDRLKPFQTADFMEILRIMKGLPVVIRLLDIPLHEFLPGLMEVRDRVRELENAGNVKELSRVRKIKAKVEELTEVNPMLGHRGVRLGLTSPDIYLMQVRAVCEATATLIGEGIDVRPEVMIPQVCSAKELERVRRSFEEVQAQVEEEMGMDIPIKFGTMIEVVRACTVADRIAAFTDFFSFGTNDLTQATFSFSREDAENTFLPYYIDNGILPRNPFDAVDQPGVGRLMDMAVKLGRRTKKNLKVGICGEHGGEPSTVGFCHAIGLNYVSCSPFRIPVARFAAAQAALKRPEELSAIWEG